MTSEYSRRKFLEFSGYAVGASTLANCSFGSDETEVPSVPANALPIPERLDGDTFNLTMAVGSMDFLDGKTTATKAYNGNYLGPTLFVRKGVETKFNVTNSLDIHTTTHWHGQHLPSNMDGGPYQMILPGETWNAQYTIVNNAGTYWYHPHTHPSGPSPVLNPDGTGGQVYDGLAGLFIIEDDLSDALPLPRSYGVDDVPLILQDRRFHDDGRFMHFPDDFNMVTDPALRKGGEFLVNGKIDATLRLGAQIVRLRILNASNARVYNLGLSDGGTFHQIVSDGGFLEAPVALTRLLIAPGERAEILIDLQGREGESFQLHSFNSENGNSYVPSPLQDTWDTTDFNLLTFEVIAPTTDAITAIPAQLTTIVRMTEQDAVNAAAPRPMELNANPFNINGLTMDMDVINHRIRLGDIEIWELTNPNIQAHPFHVHGEPFQILTRNGTLPPANEMGWKDVVLIRPDETIRIIKRFGDFSDPVLPYMYHCHILEHEDLGMMGTFTVEMMP